MCACRTGTRVPGVDVDVAVVEGYVRVSTVWICVLVYG